MTLNFMMIVNVRLFKQDMRMLPVQGRLGICLYHFLEWSVLGMMILMLEKVIVGWWLLTVPLMLLMLMLYILLHRVPIPFSAPKYAAMCAFHCAAMIIGTGFYFSGTDLMIPAPALVVMMHLAIWILYRRRLSTVKLRIHLLEEKVLNFEPLENGERVLSLENFDKTLQRYYYYLSVRDRNYKSKYEIVPSKFMRSSTSNFGISPHKPYYGLFSYERTLWVKSKDGNLIGCTLEKNSKVVYHDNSVADSNLDHLAGSDNRGLFAYITERSQKNIRLVNSRNRKVLLRKQVDTRSVFDLFGNNRFIQFGGGVHLKILDLKYRKILDMPKLGDRFFHFWHEASNKLVSIDLAYENKTHDSSLVTYTFHWHLLDDLCGNNRITETKKFLRMSMNYDTEGDMRIIAKQNRKIKVFEIDGYCYVFIVTLSKMRLLMIVLNPMLKCIKIEKLKDIKEPVLNHIMAWLGKSKRGWNQGDGCRRLIYASNYSTRGVLDLCVERNQNWESQL